MPVAPTPCNIALICREALDEVRSAHPARQLDLDVSDNLAGAVDKARLRQALSNLLNNAVQHGDPASPIGLSACAEGKELVLQVKNLGEPIPAHALQVIFDPLVQLSPKSSAGGDSPSTNLGLGLFIAREVALGHKGTLEVESDREHGTVFTMRLPMGAPGG
jgi:signal transduction histidine kinase